MYSRVISEQQRRNINLGGSSGKISTLEGNTNSCVYASGSVLCTFVWKMDVSKVNIVSHRTYWKTGPYRFHLRPYFPRGPRCLGSHQGQGIDQVWAPGCWRQGQELRNRRLSWTPSNSRRSSSRWLQTGGLPRRLCHCCRSSAGCSRHPSLLGSSRSTRQTARTRNSDVRYQFESTPGVEGTPIAIGEGTLRMLGVHVGRGERWRVASAHHATYRRPFWVPSLQRVVPILASWPSSP